MRPASYRREIAHSERMTCLRCPRERYWAVRFGVRRSHVRYSRTMKPASRSAVRSFVLLHNGRSTSTSPSAVGKAMLTFKPGESPRAVTTSTICGAWTSLSSSQRRYESNGWITHRRLPASTVSTAAPWRTQPRRTRTLKRTGQSRTRESCTNAVSAVSDSTLPHDPSEARPCRNEA